MWKDQGVGGWIAGQSNHLKGSAVKKRSNAYGRQTNDEVSSNRARGTSPFLRAQSSPLSRTRTENVSPTRSPAFDGSASLQHSHRFGTRALPAASALHHSANIPTHTKTASDVCGGGFVTRGVQNVDQQQGTPTSVIGASNVQLQQQRSSGQCYSPQQEIIETQNQPTWVTITGADPGDFHHVIHYFQGCYGPIKRIYWPAVSRQCSWIHVQFFDHAVARYCVENGGAFSAEGSLRKREVTNPIQISIPRCHRSSCRKTNPDRFSTKQLSFDIIEVVPSWCKDYAIMSKYAEEDYEMAVAMSLLSGGGCTEGDGVEANTDAGGMRSEGTDCTNFGDSEGSNKDTKSDVRQDEDVQLHANTSYSVLGRLSALATASLKFKTLKTQPQTSIDTKGVLRMNGSLSKTATLEQSSIASGDAALSIQRPQRKGSVSSYLFYANNNSSIYSSQLSNQHFQQRNGDLLYSRGGNRGTLATLSNLTGGSSHYNGGNYTISFTGRYNTISKAERKNDEVYVPPVEGFNDTSGQVTFRYRRSARGLWGHYDLPLLSRWTSNFACFAYSMLGGRYGAEGRSVTGRSTLARIKGRDTTRLDGSDSLRGYNDISGYHPYSLSSHIVNSVGNLMRFSYDDTEDEEDIVDELQERIQLDREIERDIMLEMQRSSFSGTDLDSLLTNNDTNIENTQRNHLHIPNPTPVKNHMQTILIKRRKRQEEMRRRRTIRYRFFSKDALKKCGRITKRFFLRHFYHRMPQREVCCSDIGTNGEVHIVLRPETFFLSYVNMMSIILLVFFLYVVIWGCVFVPVINFICSTFCDFWFIATGGSGVSFLGQCSSAFSEESVFQYLLGGAGSGTDWRSFFYTYSQEDHKYRHPVTEPAPFFWRHGDSSGSNGVSSTYYDAYGGGVADFYYAIFGGENKEPPTNHHDYVYY